MRFAIVGLGRTGLSLGQLAVERGHDVVAWGPDRSTRADYGDSLWEGFDVVAPLLRDMAVDDQAVHHVGPSPSGHFVKLERS
jgi:6-phosphogluconate dehydrogenase (decarboxylating)